MSTINNIDSKTLNKWLKNDEALLIDVREMSEYIQEHIEFSRNIPITQILIEDMSIPKYQNKKIVIQCHSGKRSMLACQDLSQIYPLVEFYNLDGGIIAWKGSQYQTIKL